VPDGIHATVAYLSETDNEAAENILIPALDSEHASVRHLALRALLERRSPTGGREILRRLDTYDDDHKAIIRQRPGSLASAMRGAVLGTDEHLCANACDAILWFREFDLTPALVNALEDHSNPNVTVVAKTLLSLTESLNEELKNWRDDRRRRDPMTVRLRVVECLEQSVLRFSTHKRSEPVEALMMLVRRDNATLKEILRNPKHGSYLAVVMVMRNSTHPAVGRLLLSYLQDSRPPSAALKALARRSDPPFLAMLLASVGSELAPEVAHNLKKVDRIAWLQESTSTVDELEDAGQQAAVGLAMASNIPRDDIFRLVSHLVRSGKPGGRRAATAALADFNGAEANELAVALAKDADPLVRAAALRQLRSRSIPGALSILLEQAGSPDAEVREAVRASLAEFSFSRFLSSFDTLDDEVRRSTGMLVKKIDPETIPLLREEMASHLAKRRLRALDVASTIEAVDQLEDVVLALLKDADHLVRVEAARALARSNSPSARAALKVAAEDSSAAVREAAVATLGWIETHLDGFPTSGSPTETSP